MEDHANKMNPDGPERPWSKPAVSELDEAYLEATFAEDEGFLKEVLETYILSAEQLCAQIAAAIESENHEEVRTLAHTLKGSSRMIGANRFAQYCQNVESGDAAGVIYHGKAMLSEAPSILRECRNRLDQIRSTERP